MNGDHDGWQIYDLAIQRRCISVGAVGSNGIGIQAQRKLICVTIALDDYA